MNYESLNGEQIGALLVRAAFGKYVTEEEFKEIEENDERIPLIDNSVALILEVIRLAKEDAKRRKMENVASFLNDIQQGSVLEAIHFGEETFDDDE